MKKIYSQYQQEFEPAKIISVKAKKAQELEVEKLACGEAEEGEPQRAAKEYGRAVSRNVEIMGDLIWRYSPEDEVAEKIKKESGDHWLQLMDRMKRVMQLCDIPSPLSYGAIYDLDPIKQKIIQRELESIYGRYKLQEWAKGFIILENWFIRGERGI